MFCKTAGCWKQVTYQTLGDGLGFYPPECDDCFENSTNILPNQAAEEDWELHCVQ